MKLPRPFNIWTTYPNHVGMDYPEPDNKMVKASGKGVVTWSGWFSKKAAYGVSIDYGNGVMHSYKHSDKNDWRILLGSVVELGTNIMQVGGSGEGSTGPHLHHEVFVNGVIQTGDNYWKYVDKSANGYVGAPKPVNIKQKDNDMDFLYVRGDGSASIHQIDVKTGLSKGVNPTQWKLIVASYQKQGKKDPLVEVKGVTEADILRAYPRR